MKYKRVIFNHIPKCGGTYVRIYLRMNTDYDIIVYKLDMSLEDNPVPTDGVLVSSHFVFTDWTPIDGDFYFTFIRHPVDALFSDYYYTKTNHHTMTKVWPDYDEKGKKIPFNIMKKKSLYEFVDWFIDVSAKDGILYPLDFNARYFNNLHKLNYNMIGVLEKMDQSMIKLCTMLGIEYTPTGHEERNANKHENPDYSYRRDELCVIFADQIKNYDLVLQSYT